MRKLVIALVAAALASRPVCAQTTEWANKLFEETSKDFGTHPHGTQLKHSFKMTNIYKVPLEITEVRVSCSRCLTHTLTKKEGNKEVPLKVLQPNETGYLNVHMDGTKFTGQKVISIHVRVGPQYISTATLTVQAVARQDVTFNPGSINFGVVGRGQTPTQSIEVEYAGFQDWQITEIVKNASAPFAVEAKELYRERPKSGGPIGLFKQPQPGKVGYRLTLKLKADIPPGPFKQELLLKTNDPNTPTLTVTAEGRIQASLTVNPSTVSLGDLKVGDTAKVRVLVRGDRAFRITGVEGHGDGLRVELPDKAQESQIVTFHFEAKTPGEIRRQIRIRTDMDNETAAVLLEGSVSARAEKATMPPPQ